MKQGDIWGLVSIFLVLVFLAALFVFAPRRSEIAFVPEEVPGSTLVLVSADESRVVIDAVLGKPGFITLHQLIGNAPGPIVATSELLSEGIHSGFELFPSGALSVQDSYVLLMVVDDGDGVYEVGVDRPVMVQGQVIRVPVSLSAEKVETTP
jgi:hypothetical protein